jgi:hypothetical protein
MDPRKAVPSKELTFKPPWQPNQPATPRASRIPDDQWAKYKDRIVKWHGIGFTQPQIKTLLQQSGLAVTYAHSSLADDRAEAIVERTHCTHK